MSEPIGHCRFCAKPLTQTFVDLGMSPLSNAYIQKEALNKKELFYPLHALVCSGCFLVQLDEFESPEAIFSDYAYFSSYSDSWLEHARQYTEAMRTRFRLDASKLVVELASNDGYLLQYFVKAGVPVLGVEPAANVAKVAEEKGVPSLVKFFGVETAKEIVRTKGGADLVVANNVLAHVPALNDFVGGLPIVLKPQGVVTIEFPHVARLIESNQFDTIYHEHFSYLSLLTVQQVFAKHGLRVFDVDELPTHGGSIRVYGCRTEASHKDNEQNLDTVLGLERKMKLDSLAGYADFAERVQKTKRRLLSFLISAKDQGKKVVGYGAPAKGNTLLNYCGVRDDLLAFTVDRSPHKQGRYLPGTRIPILAPEAIEKHRPDYVVILPWNIKDEVMKQMAGIRAWGGQFVIPIPEVTVL